MKKSTSKRPEHGEDLASPSSILRVFSALSGPPVTIVAVLVSCLTWGVVQERLTSVPYTSNLTGEGEVFDAPVFLNFVTAITAFLVSLVLTLIDPRQTRSGSHRLGSGTRRRLTRGDFLRFGLVAVTYSLGSPLGYAALHYIGFPLLVLSTSCKLVPVILLGLFRGKTYSRADKVSAALMVGGVVAYSWVQAVGKTDTKGTSHLILPESGVNMGTFIGLVLVVFNLFIDAIMVHGQDHFFSEFDLSSSELMILLSGGNIVLNGAYLGLEALIRGPHLASGPASIAFLTRHTDAATHLAAFTFLAAVSQFWVLHLIKTCGSFIMTAVSTGRKFLSVGLSVLMFGHHLRPLQWAGVGCVFLGLIVQIRTRDRGTHMPQQGRKRGGGGSGDGGGDSTTPPPTTSDTTIPPPSSVGASTSSLLLRRHHSYAESLPRILARSTSGDAATLSPGPSSLSSSLSALSASTPLAHIPSRDFNGDDIPPIVGGLGGADEVQVPTPSPSEVTARVRRRKGSKSRGRSRGAAGTRSTHSPITSPSSSSSSSSRRRARSGRR